MTSSVAGDESKPATDERVVVLVGAQARAAAEASLRGRDDVSLVRSASACEAVGEAMLPLGGDAANLVVCVGEDALPMAEAADFADALRASAPGARLVRVNGAAETEAHEPFDAVVPHAPTLAALLEAIGAPAMEPSRPPIKDRAQPSATQDGAADAGAPGVKENEAREPAAGAPAASRAAEATDLDEGPVQAVLRGESPLEACLARIRSATGDADVAFIPAEDHASVGPADGVPVERHGKRFGWLRAAALAPECAQRSAAWLGAWLALDAQAASLREAAFVDELTGAWNRRYFNRFLGMAIERARSLRHHVTLMLFDIDDFKTYNDQYGHAAGDTVLTQTVRLLKSEIRPSDRVCRVGGDEFAVIFDEPEGPRSPGSAPPASIADIAQRFQRQICEHRFPELSELAPGTLTISGGLATFPWDAADAESLTRRADELALASKRQGKNLLTFGPGARQVCRLAGFDEEPEPSD